MWKCFWEMQFPRGDEKNRNRNVLAFESKFFVLPQHFYIICSICPCINKDFLGLGQNIKIISLFTAQNKLNYKYNFLLYLHNLWELSSLQSRKWISFFPFRVRKYFWASIKFIYGKEITFPCTLKEFQVNKRRKKLDLSNAT